MKNPSTTIQSRKFECRTSERATAGFPSVAPSHNPIKSLFSVFTLSTFHFLLSILLLSTLYFPLSTFALTTSNVSNQNVVKNGLVGYWTFDGKNMTNATATDMSGQGNNGTLVNMTATSSATQGKIGQALTFNGTASHVTTPNIGAYDTAGNFTVSVWVKPPNQNQQGTIITRRTNAPLHTQWSLYLGGTNCEQGSSGKKIQVDLFETYSGSIYRCYYTTNDVADGKWHHLVLVSNRALATTALYVDGISASLTTYTSVGAYPNTDVSQPIVIGRNGTNGDYFLGGIDDVRYYNRAITAKEVQTLYKAGGGVLAATTPGTSNSSVGLNSGLVGYWTFDGKNMTNATATDSSGGAVNGALSNGMLAATTTVQGKLGQALKFNGTSDYIYYGTPASLDLRSNITMSAWVKPNELNRNQAIVALGSQGCCGTENLLELLYSGGNNQFYAASSLGVGAVSGYHDLMKIGTWYHVLTTWNGTVKSLYVNGTIVATSSQVSSPGDYGNKFYVGRDDNGSYFNGTIDDVRLYNRALSVQEVQSLYRLGQSKQAVTPTAPLGINSGLVGYWTFDGKNMTNATATDSSGSGNNGTLTNMTATSSATQGKIGQALNFDGSNDGVLLPGFSLPTSALTICAWIKPRSEGGGSYGRIVTTTTEPQVFAVDYQNKLEFTSNGTNILYAPISWGVWTHTCATRDATGVSSFIYTNGTVATTSSSGTPTNGGANTYIGNRNGSDRAFDGKIDDVRIYNRQLTASEIYKIYKLGAR